MLSPFRRPKQKSIQIKAIQTKKHTLATAKGTPHKAKNAKTQDVNIEHPYNERKHERPAATKKNQVGLEW